MPIGRPWKIRPMPADFAAVAPTKTFLQLRLHYRAGAGVISRWLSEAGVECLRVRPSWELVPPPADFAEIAPTMTRSELTRHYDASQRAVRRWLKTTGIEPAKRSSAVTGYRKAPVAQKRNWIRRDLVISQNHVTRDDSLEGRAADHLRAFAPVYRCDERGRFAGGGPSWRYGSVVITGEELVERAIRRGFDPEAWRAIPAFQTPRREGFAHSQGA
jgi:hypothetical protein